MTGSSYLCSELKRTFWMILSICDFLSSGPKNEDSGYFYVLDSFFSLLTISVLQGTHLRSKLLRLRIRFLLANALFSSLSIPQLCVLNQVPQGGVTILSFICKKWILSCSAWGKTSTKNSDWQVL